MTNSPTTKTPGGLIAQSASDLHRVRNVKPLWSKFGTIIGVALGGLDMWCNTLGFSLFGTQSHAKPDRKTLDPAREHQPIAYPKPDGKLTFDQLSSVFLSNTNHEEDQPVHLKVADIDLQKTSEHDVYRRSVEPLLPGRASMSGSRSRPGRASRSTPRTASTAKPATSRTRTATSPGFPRKAAAGLITRRCDHVA